ncbi:hypothetical protein [Streptomyces sp. KL118A]|uniref:hypothetical protein n=1 Tax=Streptomyces sp. KL118A TaxID=3045153 RepID=UPI00278C845A|nr:hypothetical protein [Streptomyces sp. KL118A]
MSTTPQMSQLGQQQGRQYGPQQQQYGQQYGPQQYGSQPYGPQQYGSQQSPSTAPPQQQSQQQYGPQQGMQGMQGIQGQPGMHQGMQQHVPQQLRQQLQQLGQQQPFQTLLQQFGQEQEIPQAQAPEISTQALASNVATAFWDVVEPLPGQAYILYLHVDNAWRAFVNPNPQTHDEVQEAFAFGQQVIGYYDTNNPGYLLAIVITK